jgi:hypothetical protein
VDRAVALRAAVRARALPNDLVAEIPVPEDAIHHHFDVVARGGIAVQVNRSGVAKDRLHEEQPVHHVDQIREQVRLRGAKRVHPQAPEVDVIIVNTVLAHQLGNVPRELFLFGVHLPRVAERFRLLGHRLARERLVNEVVVLLRVERGIEVDEIDATARDPLHDREVVTVIQTVLGHRFGRNIGSSTAKLFKRC